MDGKLKCADNAIFKCGYESETVFSNDWIRQWDCTVFGGECRAGVRNKTYPGFGCVFDELRCETTAPVIDSESDSDATRDSTSDTLTDSDGNGNTNTDSESDSGQEDSASVDGVSQTFCVNTGIADCSAGGPSAVLTKDCYTEGYCVINAQNGADCAYFPDACEDGAATCDESGSFIVGCQDSVWKQLLDNCAPGGHCAPMDNGDVSCVYLSGNCVNGSTACNSEQTHLITCEDGIWKTITACRTPKVAAICAQPQNEPAQCVEAK